MLHLWVSGLRQLLVQACANDSFRVWGFEPPHSNVLLSGFGISNPRTPFWGLSLRQLLLLGLGVSFESTLAISFLDQDFKAHSILGLRCGEPPHSIFWVRGLHHLFLSLFGFQTPVLQFGFGVCNSHTFHGLRFRTTLYVGFGVCTI